MGHQDHIMGHQDHRIIVRMVMDHRHRLLIIIIDPHVLEEEAVVMCCSDKFLL